MISSSHIQQLAGKLQTTELNARREYVQNLFLSYFFQQPGSEKILFKGGTALRIIYHSPRFSEDLDFSSTRVTAREIEDVFIQTLREIEREGIAVDPVESKKTSGGYIAIARFVLSGQEVAVQLEVSQRRGQNRGEVKTIVNDFIPPYTLVTLPQDRLISEKVRALLTRQKARDFYDLYFILRANLLPTSEKRVLKGVLALLDKSELRFEPELKLFLPKSHWAVIRNFKATLTREIQRQI